MSGASMGGHFISGQNILAIRFMHIEVTKKNGRG